jgi:transposase-like protein
MHRKPSAPAHGHFPATARPRDEELTRLRKENRALKETNELLKKAAVIFAQGDPQ